MTEKPKKLSETARALLTAAAARDDHLIRPPQLPAAAARQVVRSLLNAGLAEEIPAPIEDAAFVWRRGDDGSDLVLRATDLGLACIREAEGTVPIPDSAEAAVVIGPVGEPQADQDIIQAPPQPKAAPAADESSDAVQDTPTVPVRSARQNRLRQAARALLEAWDASASADALDEHFAVLRAALAMQASASPLADHPRPPRDTKQARVLAMLRRSEGASGPQIGEEMGWAPHTVRGFLAGLAKKGMWSRSWSASARSVQTSKGRRAATRSTALATSDSHSRIVPCIHNSARWRFATRWTGAIGYYVLCGCWMRWQRRFLGISKVRRQSDL